MTVPLLERPPADAIPVKDVSRDALPDTTVEWLPPSILILLLLPMAATDWEIWKVDLATSNSSPSSSTEVAGLEMAVLLRECFTPEFWETLLEDAAAAPIDGDVFFEVVVAGVGSTPYLAMSSANSLPAAGMMVSTT